MYNDNEEFEAVLEMYVDYVREAEKTSKWAFNFKQLATD